MGHTLRRWAIPHKKNWTPPCPRSPSLFDLRQRTPQQPGLAKIVARFLSRICASMASCRPGARFDGAATTLLSRPGMHPSHNCRSSRRIVGRRRKVLTRDKWNSGQMALVRQRLRVSRIESQTSGVRRSIPTQETDGFRPAYDSGRIRKLGVFTSASPGCLDGGDVDLLHRHHRLEGALCLITASRQRIG